MHYFQYKKNKLYAEEVPVEKIVQEVGTPVYIYSHSTLERHFKAFQDAFKKTNALICFSMKCNSNIAILRSIAQMGGGVDIVSGGELFRALRAGVNPRKIVYSGVGKTDEEIAQALKANILMFNVESEEELEHIQSVAARLKKKAPISLRVNPNIDPKTHPYISTGMKKSKFGIDVKNALEIYAKAQKLSHIHIVGLDCHIGSQLTQIRPFVDALKKLKELLKKIEALGISIQYLDLGGGLGIRYNQENPPSPADYAKAILSELKDLNLTLIFEPGRVLMGNAGILVTETLYSKKNPAKEFVIVDAAMNDLIRPAFYGSYHDIQPIEKKKRASRKTDVVGPICESGDFFAKDRSLPETKSGECLALFSAGAYGFAMSSNYNTRPRAAEVLVKGKQFDTIRKRESLEDLIRGESIPSFLKK
ncbi:MAG: diaminopimelate decarboxylase [Deltaproteobacteria bacterium]|nr:diaminopimelate decarboxylase [Deltaproteobacteria bacterium]